MPINLLLDQTDPPLIKRARCYERGALEELFNRNIDTVYVLAYALSGETAAAEQIAEAAFVQTLAKLHRFSGDGRGFGAWVLRLAATMIRRSGGEEGGIRSDYVRLSAQLKEILALRIFGGLDCERIAYLTHRPIPDVRLRLVEALRRLGQGNRRGSEENLQSFDQAVSRVLTEPLPESFELSAPDDARELLAIAYTLADLPRQPLPTEARLRLRSAFIAASSSHRALWAQRNQRAATVPGVVIHRARRRLRAASTILVVSVVTLVAGSTLAFAGMFSGPDSPLYPVKQLSESILLVFNRQPVSRAEFEFKMAATRSREAEDMSLAGRGDLAVAAMRGRFDALRAAGQDLERAPRRDARWTEARNHFSSLAAQSTASIQSDLVSAHQGDAAGQIKNLTGQFQRDRQQLDAALGSATDSSSS